MGRIQLRFMLSFVFCLSAFLGAGLVLVRILQNPSEPQSAFLWGYSLPRLILGVGILLPMIIFGALSILLALDKNKRQLFWQWAFEGKSGVFWTWFCAGLSFFSGIGVAIPSYRLGSLAYVFFYLRPILYWLFFLSALFLIIALIGRNGVHRSPLLESLRFDSEALKFSVSTLLLFVFLSLIIAYTGLGIRLSEDRWYGAGIPILPQQLFLSLAALAVIFLVASKRTALPSDYLMFLAIWLISALAWAGTPLQRSYFMPGPYYPNRQFYPFSDAALFDLGSQFALIGQGILNGQFFNRPLYIAFLVYLHGLVGQDYDRLLAFQAAIYAVLPALMYLLGKELLGRWLGLLLAILTLWRGVNAIWLSPWVDTSGPKMMLTDFPTTIVLVIFTLLVMRWVKEPARSLQQAIWAGGMVGLGVMLRTHALLLIFLLIFLAMVVIRSSFQRRLLIAGFMVLAMFITTLPWDVRNYQRGGPFLGVYFVQIQSVLNERYFDLRAPEQQLPLNEIHKLVAFTGFRGGHETFQDIEPPLTSHASNSYAKPSLASLKGQNPAVVEKIPTFLTFVTSHFLHNLITSIFILPHSFSFDDLRSLVKTEAPFWKAEWHGTLSGGSAVFLSIYLVLISLGIGYAWHRNKWIGLIPLLVFVIYNTSNALARTSGGRYIVPIDWVVLVYFVIGAAQVFHWLQIAFGLKQGNLRADQDAVLIALQVDRLPCSAIGRTFAALLVIGALVPLSEHLYPRRYSPSMQEQNLLLLQERGLLQRAGLDETDIQTFLQSSKAVVSHGRVLYPRFYLQGDGETPRSYPYHPLDYPRLAFMLIGADGEHGIVLPILKSPRYFPHAADVVVLACRDSSGTNALAVFILDEKNIYYMRQPNVPLRCPVAAPVCNDNRECY